MSETYVSLEGIQLGGYQIPDLLRVEIFESENFIVKIFHFYQTSFPQGGAVRA